MLERLGMRVRGPFGEGSRALDDDYAVLVKQVNAPAPFATGGDLADLYPVHVAVLLRTSVDGAAVSDDLRPAHAPNSTRLV